MKCLRILLMFFMFIMSSGRVEAGYKGPPKGEGKPQSLPPEPPKPPSDQKSNES